LRPWTSTPGSDEVTTRIRLVEVGILGALEVGEGGDVVSIDAPKERALLEVLAIRVGEVVQAGTLVGALWGEDAPQSALRSLQSHLSRLRGALPDGLISTSEQGYSLMLHRDDVDAHRFEQLVASGREALGVVDPRRALPLLDDALQLWRGTPLVDLADGAFRNGQVTRLTELKATAEELRVQARLALGHHEELIAEIEVLVADSPLRERRWAQLMMALSRSGRRADALAAYGRLRDVLREELGVSPSAPIRELESQILLEDQSLDAPISPPARTVPTPLTPFIGRERHIPAIRRLLDEHRLVTLLGPGGVGKTRLAIEVADTDPDRWTDGVWWIDLSHSDGASALTQLVTTLGIVPAPGMPPHEGLLRFAKTRSMLLVVDRAERDVVDVGPLLTELLESAPGLAALVTSRMPLDVVGERRVLVPALEVPTLDPQAHETDAGHTEAVRLFLDRMADRSADWSAGPDDPFDDVELEAISELCRVVDGSPLGVELLAARVGARSAVELSVDLRDDPRLLLAGPGRDDDPHGSLGVVFESTAALLNPGQQELFARLAVFPGTFDLSAVRAVGGLAEDFDRLLDVALVQRASAHWPEHRYRLSDPTQAYASTLLDEDLRADAESRHAEHVREFVIRAGAAMDGPDEREWLARLHRDEADTRRALAWWLEHDPIGALPFARALGRSLRVSGRDDEACEVLGRMVDGVAPLSNVDPGDLGWVRLRRGWPRFLTGDMAGALDDVVAATELFGGASDEVGLAQALADQAHMTLLTTADDEPARSLYRDAIEAARRAGRRPATAMVLAEAAQALILSDRLDGAVVEMMDEAEAVFVDVGSDEGLAHVSMDRVLAAYAIDDLDVLERHADEGIRHSRRTSNRTYEQILVLAKGVRLMHLGDLNAAAGRLERGVRLAADHHNLMQLGVALHAVSVHARLSEMPERAARLSGAAQVLAPRWPLFERRYGELLASVPDASDVSFQAEIVAGTTQSLEETLSLAREQLSQAPVI
jgi:predicted ATPase/DNA-binding SARP family transcriptional activator